MRPQKLPKVIFGTSALGNLFAEPSFQIKKDLVQEVLKASHDAPLFDSAGKYGAGLALEALGQALDELGVGPADVRISNKLGWRRVPLLTEEPTFEPGAWVNLKHDAVQTISYQGIMECFAQGNELLGKYRSRIASIHDPDEYLAAATNESDQQERFQHIVEGYRALSDLKSRGEIDSIGVGSKDPGMIDRISRAVSLDWAMFACAITPYTHAPHVVNLVKRLGSEGVAIINSAVFNSGFLIGGQYFDYQLVNRDSHSELYQWRDNFLAICAKYSADPAAVCVQFSFHIPEIVSVALNTSSPKRVESNLALANVPLNPSLWDELKDKGLIQL